MNIEKLNGAYADFTDQPSEANKVSLLEEIDAYPLHWGKGMAEGRNIGEEIAKRSRMTLAYQPERLDQYVTEAADGRRLSLLLQTRVENGVRWHVVSWRSVYEGTNSNRRFYMNKHGEPWSTPVESALHMLEHAEGNDWLVDENLDLRQRPECDVSDSRDLNRIDSEELFASIVVAGESFETPDYFVVCTDSHESWRKVMIVNNDRVTFRGLTTNPEYGMLKHLDNGTDWNLDNSMQDINVQQARAFLEALRR